ncbi:hypothetical protein [Acidovorax sp. MR-S7]|uniref:hypothetical protein n=1 Tax=Acidovorax sp. MR-S7 TaxID=1268622 RepID=UPI0003796F16|nr:hypothetical protein [Acidovorax sp. MR-S7]GAD20975.1 hypothetical protein AVS7_00736 [Acidovorax sp. MR-S7]
MSEQEQGQRITRVIDFRIPLPWLLGIGMAVGWALVSMWFSVNQLVRDVADLQITVKAGNTQATTVAGEIALLRFRVENLEAANRQPTKGGER